MVRPISLMRFLTKLMCRSCRLLAKNLPSTSSIWLSEKEMISMLVKGLKRFLETLLILLFSNSKSRKLINPTNASSSTDSISLLNRSRDKRRAAPENAKPSIDLKGFRSIITNSKFVAFANAYLWILFNPVGAIVMRKRFGKVVKNWGMMNGMFEFWILIPRTLALLFPPPWIPWITKSWFISSITVIRFMSHVYTLLNIKKEQLIIVAWELVVTTEVASRIKKNLGQKRFYDLVIKTILIKLLTSSFSFWFFY